jgi:O-antigen/teichoic acid export membrane protein
MTDAFMRLTASTLIVATPAGIGISSLAAPAVAVAFGAKWLEATPIVEILAIAGIFAVVSGISATLFSAFANLRLLFWNIIAMSAIRFALLVPFVWYAGIVGAAIATALAVLVEQLVLSVLAFRRFAMHLSDLLSRAWRCLAASAAMTVFLAFSGLGWAPAQSDLGANLRHLGITSASGAAVYTAVLLGLWLASGRPRGPETDVLDLLKEVGTRLHAMISRRAALLWTAGSR